MGAKNGSDERPQGTPPTVRGQVADSPGDAAGQKSRIDPGSVLGKYRVVRLLGTGGMGAVYEALHIEIGKPVALKVLSGDLARDPRAQSRFLQEAAAVSSLRHPHVVNVADYGTQDGVPYIVMELLRGEDLADHLANHGQGLAVDTAVDILLAICAGVSAAHQAGITHRDLKPRNIFLDRSAIRERDPKVLDFGISKVEGNRLAESLTDTGALIGTTHYMSPEQVLGKPVGFQTDQYSLGVVLYECLTGRRPHEGDTVFAVIRSIGDGAFRPPSVLRPDLAPGLEAVILRAMALEPANRFATVHAFGAALLPFASSRKRVHWHDYYTRDPLEASLTGGDADGGIPPEAPMPALPRTVKLPEDERRPAPHAPPPQTRVIPFVPPHDRELKPSIERPAERRWLRPATAASIVGCVAAGGLLLWWGLRGVNGPVERAPIPVSTSTVVIPPSPRSEVTIDVVDGPPGLVAIVDGQEMEMPLRLPRESRQRVVVFRAPGSVPREVTIDARADRTISVTLEKEAPSEIRKREEPRDRSKKPVRPTQKRERRPDSPPPFRDF